MATYAIGDIQGCYQSFQKLLKKINFKPTSDTLWLAGDMINRGPQSLATINYIINHQSSIRCVLGNHDLHFLAVAHGAKAATPKDTFHDILNSTDRDDIVDWLKKQPLIHFDQRLNTAMVHAGIPPQWSLKKAQEYAAEVSHSV